MRLPWVPTSRSLAILVTSLALFALTGCSGYVPMDVLSPYSVATQQIADLFYFVFWIAVVIFILVEGALVYFVIRYQRRAQDEHPEQYHGNTPLEITWTVIPALILVVVFGFTIRTMGQVGPTRPPGQGTPMQVVAHQWWWEFRYDQGRIGTANELHLPAGQLYTVDLASEDVIHSFWVPKIMGKTDTVPGQINKTWLLGDTTGVFEGQCAEFCGAQHAHMQLRIIVQTPGDFNRWLEEQKAPPVEPARGSLAAQGKEMLTDPNLKCVACHNIQGTPAVGRTGPDLTHFASRSCFAGCMFPLTHDNLVKWLTSPEQMKPGNLMARTLADLNPRDPTHPLTADQVAALTAYLESLR